MSMFRRRAWYRVSREQTLGSPPDQAGARSLRGDRAPRPRARDQPLRGGATRDQEPGPKHQRPASAGRTVGQRQADDGGRSWINLAHTPEPRASSASSPPTGASETCTLTTPRSMRPPGTRRAPPTPARGPRRPRRRRAAVSTLPRGDGARPRPIAPRRAASCERSARKTDAPSATRVGASSPESSAVLAVAAAGGPPVGAGSRVRAGLAATPTQPRVTRTAKVL